MTKFLRPLQLRWSDMDPNFHVRHSVYYDFAAQLRTEYLFSKGLSAAHLAEHHIGPILFREEATFRRELRFGDDLTMDLEVTALRRDGSRFSVQHHIFKGEELCATVKIDGAWMDTVKRKITAPSALGLEVFSGMPKAKDFRWED